MNIDFVSQAALTSDANLTASVAPPPFSQRIQAEIESVNSKLTASETSLQEFAAGKQSNIHHLMLTLEDARLSFQLLTQVRNKALEAYQELLRMQI